jgi:hypothetical protein
MKLLFDENLSPKLPSRLSDLFPDSLHVRDVGMKATIDPTELENGQPLTLYGEDLDRPPVQRRNQSTEMRHIGRRHNRLCRFITK